MSCLKKGKEYSKWKLNWQIKQQQKINLPETTGVIIVMSWDWNDNSRGGQRFSAPEADLQKKKRKKNKK